MARKKSKKNSSRSPRPPEGTEAVVRGADFMVGKSPGNRKKHRYVEKSWEELKDKSSAPLEKALDTATGVYGPLSREDILGHSESENRQVGRWILVSAGVAACLTAISLWKRQR